MAEYMPKENLVALLDDISGIADDRYPKIGDVALWTGNGGGRRRRRTKQREQNFVRLISRRSQRSLEELDAAKI